MTTVALRKESVDRNSPIKPVCEDMDLSLSARRAWIEMVIDFPLDQFAAVALRKESVDRNIRDTLWIACHVVALRKESVDRNRCNLNRQCGRSGRSPQGERG